MLICYVDRTYLTNKQIEEIEEFIEGLRETILVTRCCETLPTKEQIELRAEQALFGFEDKSRKFDDYYYFGYCDGAEFIKQNITK